MRTQSLTPVQRQGQVGPVKALGRQGNLRCGYEFGLSALNMGVTDVGKRTCMTRSSCSLSCSSRRPSVKSSRSLREGSLSYEGPKPACRSGCLVYHMPAAQLATRLTHVARSGAVAACLPVTWLLHTWPRVGCYCEGKADRCGLHERCRTGLKVQVCAQYLLLVVRDSLHRHLPAHTSVWTGSCCVRVPLVTQHTTLDGRPQSSRSWSACR